MSTALRSPRSLVDGRRQLLLISGLTLIYFAVRAATAQQRDEAFANASDVLAFEERFGLDLEAVIHDAAMTSEPLIRFLNAVYLWGHFPLLIAALLVLWAQRHRDYARLRNALIISGAIGLVAFAVYPVAPPRLYAPQTFFDTVHELSASHRVLQNPRFTNQFAAIPSFHVGWNLLVALALCRSTSRRSLRALAACMPLLMSVAVVATANHWIIDLAVGAAVALIGWFGARLAPTKHAEPEQQSIIDLRDDAPSVTPTEPVMGPSQTEPSIT